MAKPISDLAREKVRQLIADHHLALAVEVLGPGAVSKDDYDRLVRNNILRQGSIEHAQVAIQAAHTVGKMAASAPKNDLSLARMSPEKFWLFVATAPPQFSQHELDAINATKDHVGRLIGNLSMSMINDFEQSTHEEATKLRHEALGIVQHEIALGIARRSSKEQIERRFKKKLKDTQRDWALIVATELHNAKEHGKALGIAADGFDPLVYKTIQPDACRFCRMLYTNGRKPRLFRLSELANNGTNYGRRAVHPKRAGRTEWRPVIGVVHPGCQCELHEMPAGFAFDANGKIIASTKKSMSDDITYSVRALMDHQCEV